MVQLNFNFLIILSKHLNYCFTIKNKYIIVIENKLNKLNQLNQVEPQKEGMMKNVRKKESN